MISKEEQERIERMLEGDGLKKLILIGENTVFFVEQNDVSAIAHLLK